MAKKCAKPGCSRDAEKDSNYCWEHKPKLQPGQRDEFDPPPGKK